ncbi:hypothetical protein ACHWQZ_G008393 [Mnemiopsis leidyi]
MGRSVTRSQSKSGSRSQNKDCGDSSSKSEETLKSTQTGRISKRKTKKSSMSKRDSSGSNLEESVLSLSLEDPATLSQEPCSSKLLPSTQGPAVAAEDSSKVKTSDLEKPECSICLQTALQPAALPCNHIFCFLCIKGAVHNGTNSCALCRAPLPRNFIFNPEVIGQSSSSEDNSTEETAADKWYYEGRNGGWWEFDVRTAEQIEALFNDGSCDGPKTLELMIAGLIFIIDLNAMCQVRKNNPNIRRRIKRDKEINDKKGVAGIVKSSRRNHGNRSRGTPV